MSEQYQQSAPETTPKSLYGQIPLAPIQAGGLLRITDAWSKVYAAICAKNRGRYPIDLSIAELRQLTGKGTGTVYRAIAGLKSAGLISEEEGKFTVLRIPTSGNLAGDTLFPPVGRIFPPVGENVPPVGIPTISKVLKREKRVAPDGTHRATVKHFCEAWEAKYKSKFPFVGGKDGNHIKTLLKHSGDSADKARQIINRYLASEDPFIVGKNHPLGMLISQIATYIVEPKSGLNHGNKNKPTAVRPGEYEPSRPGLRQF